MSNPAKPEASAPPTPAIEHLPTVFRRIRSGEYRVPPFQREFVWDEKQVLELLESVYRGYPIGSALLWKVDKQVFKSIKDQSVGFPIVTDEYPTSFVLDGVQRLSTLNGVFNRDSVVDDKRFDVHFDLIGERFLSGKDLNASIVTIPLRTVFRPRDFLEEQRRLSSLENSDTLLERAVALLTVFQEYLFPTVTIFDKNPQNVISIFQKINSTGIRLGVVDFMRALTWSDDFDLNKALLSLQSHFEERGFQFDDELLLKSLGIVMGLQPLPDLLLALRGTPAPQLKSAAIVLQRKLDEVIEFVVSTVGMASSQALPYEAQWLFLFRLRCEEIDLYMHKAEVSAWIRTTSFTEALQGRPDHALVRMIDDLTSLMNADSFLPSAPVHLGTDDVLFKKFLRGKAMTVAYVQCLIQRGLFDRLPLPEIPYEKFLPIFDREDLFAFFGRETSSARTIGNVLYLPGIKRSKTSMLEFITNELSPDEDMRRILEVQFVDDEFLDDVKEGRYHQACLRRALKIVMSVPIAN